MEKELVFIGENGEAVTDSNKVAEVFGKQHQHVLRKMLDSYFGQAMHRIDFVRCRGNVIIDIEYQDFRSDQVVETEIRHLIGSGFLLNIKRECSESLMQEIRDLLYCERGSKRLMMHLMSTFVPCQTVVPKNI